MADNKSIATRDSYGAALLELADAGHDDIVVFDADLSASTRTSVFAKKYSERFFDCGIAECNMVGVAAGMSTFGYVPFVSSFAMFAAGRAFEQIRNSIGYPELNVKIAATHGGLSVGEDGASHQCCEDFALMRTIPGMVVICPSDDLEARAAVRAAYAHKGPVYLRFSRLATPSLHDANNYTFEIGKGEVLCDGFDLAIISTGLMTSEALKAAVTLKRQDAISVRVINMPTIKPIDEDIILTAARECRRIITVEEHSIIGGLGEAVCSVVAEKLPVPVRRIGVMDQFGHSGPAAEVLRDYGLTAENIVSAVREMVRPDQPAAELTSTYVSAASTSRFLVLCLLSSSQINYPLPLSGLTSSKHPMAAFVRPFFPMVPHSSPHKEGIQNGSYFPISPHYGILLRRRALL